jgi:hypothetical protein
MQYPSHTPSSRRVRPQQPPVPAPLPPQLKELVWQGKIGPAFWTIASIISLSINVTLIILLILVGRELFSLKGLISNQLVGGLYDNFVQMDQAHIKTTIAVQDTIQVNDTLPVVFDLPLNQETQVVLTKNTPVNNASVYLNGVPVTTDIVLKKGTPLNIQLNMSVPVSQTIPVVLNVPVHLEVPVDIPLKETELHQPFTGLQNVVSPYDKLLNDLPSSWEQTPLCHPLLGWICNWLKE